MQDTKEKYKDIANDIRTKMKKGCKYVSSIGRIAIEYNVSKSTAAKVLRLLHSMGFVEKGCNGYIPCKFDNMPEIRALSKALRPLLQKYKKTIQDFVQIYKSECPEENLPDTLDV